ncbi:MAG: hypothetical protein ISR91_06795 [Candidatus Delongbacteria bacterium]|nr:hypothetical protein [Candidatus Delongbacteria bacterium]
MPTNTNFAGLTVRSTILSPLLLVGLVVAVGLLSDQEPAAVTESTFDNVWMFAPIPDEYLTATASHWSTEVGLSGFIHSGVLEWYSPDSEINARFKAIQQMNRTCDLAGMSGSFLKIALGYKKFPAWQDSVGIAEVLHTFEQVFDFGREASYRGIALDIEAHGNTFWTEEVDRIAMMSFAAALGKLKRERFPDGLLMILPENMLFKEARYLQAGDFVATFFQAVGDPLFYLGTETTYRSYKPVDLEKRLMSLQEKLDVWLTGLVPEIKVQLAPGFWPLGYYKTTKDPITGKRSYTDSQGREVPDTWRDKSPNYSALEFQEQLSTAARLNFRSIWIYSHGAAWWSLPDNDYKYVLNRNNQLLPVCTEIEEYESVIRNFQVR